MIPNLSIPAATSIREGLSTDELWSGEDRGLILCWEKGRQRAAENPSLAARAVAGELVETCWCRNSFHYLAYWQGLRDENLSIIALEGSFQTITCSVTGRSFAVGPYSKERDRAQAKCDRQLLASKKAQ